MNARSSQQIGSCPLRRLPNLILCPTTLLDHWAFEIRKFLPDDALRPVVYRAKNAGDRIQLLRAQLARSGSADVPPLVFIASYEALRSDVDALADVQFNYCVLDEGHVIKNVRSRLSAAVRRVRAEHRLLLTGTPIQNSIGDLWALFDYLLPGYLGAEKEFAARFVRPILASRAALLADESTGASASASASASGAAQQTADEEAKETRASTSNRTQTPSAGIVALETLHRLVLPFVLRRMKENVLKDLPPKILQDYYCELTPIQARTVALLVHVQLSSIMSYKTVDCFWFHLQEELYNEFLATSSVNLASEFALSSSSAPDNSSSKQSGDFTKTDSAFATLHYLKKVHSLLEYGTCTSTCTLTV